MKLWVGDERPAPDDSWTVARNSDAAISHLYMIGTPAVIEMGDSLEEISLDHDLGGDDTGFKVLDWIISWSAWPKILTIHTANPPARKRMLAAAKAEAPQETEIYVITDHGKRN